MANQVTGCLATSSAAAQSGMNSRPLHANRRPWELAGVGQRRPQAVHAPAHHRGPTPSSSRRLDPKGGNQDERR